MKVSSSEIQHLNPPATMDSDPGILSVNPGTLLAVSQGEGRDLSTTARQKSTSVLAPPPGGLPTLPAVPTTPAAVAKSGSVFASPAPVLINPPGSKDYAGASKRFPSRHSLDSLTTVCTSAGMYLTALCLCVVVCTVCSRLVITLASKMHS